MQLAWNYEQQFRGENGFQVGGKPVQTLYFSEVVADFGKGTIEEACDPHVYGACATATLFIDHYDGLRIRTPLAELSLGTHPT
jgi:hypothetical protein